MPQHCCSLSPWGGNNGAGKAQVQQNQGGRRNFSQASEKGGRVKPGPLSKEEATIKSLRLRSRKQGEAALQVESIIRTGRGQGGTAGADSRQSHTALVLLVTLLQWMTRDKSSPMSPLPVLIRRGLSCNSKSAQCASSTTSRVRCTSGRVARNIYARRVLKF